MKIIHCADIHLGSKLESKFSGEKSDVRKKEVLNTFSRMIDYAERNGVRAIILAGDVFDKDKPATKDKDYFYKQIKNHPNIDFLYLNGNHDKEGSYVEKNIANLKTFSKEKFISYKYGDVVVSGIEMTQNNARSFYSQLALDKNKINIVVLHGDATDAVGMDKVRIDYLKNKNIDYLALGHIHTYKRGRIDDRGEWAFPGCLEGRGFDERGEKGFIALDVGPSVKAEFVPFACRTIFEIEVDVTGAKDLFDVEKRVKEKTAGIDKKNVLRVVLTGELPVGTEVSEKDIEVALSSYFFIDVKDKTTLKIDVADYAYDRSLIGEFVRGVYANGEYSEEEKQKLISMGLKAIAGKEVE